MFFLFQQELLKNFVKKLMLKNVSWFINLTKYIGYKYTKYTFKHNFKRRNRYECVTNSKETL